MGGLQTVQPVPDWPGKYRLGSLFVLVTRQKGGAEGETRSRRHEKGARGVEVIQRAI